MGTERFPVHVTEVTGDERTEAWGRIVMGEPGLRGIPRNTERTNPVLALTRIDWYAATGSRSPVYRFHRVTSIGSDPARP